MKVDQRLKSVVIEMLLHSSVASIIRFCEENGIDGDCLELLKSEQRHYESSRGSQFHQ